MLLGGLWHGANWTFAFWGGLNGLVLILEKLLIKRTKKVLSAPIQAIRIMLEFVFVSLTLIFFRAGSFATSWLVLKGIFTFQNGVRHPFSWVFVTLAIYIIAAIAAIRRSNEKDWSKVNGYYPILDLGSVRGLTIFFVELGLILALAYTGENPFVYFQF